MSSLSNLSEFASNVYCIIGDRGLPMQFTKQIMRVCNDKYIGALADIY